MKLAKIICGILFLFSFMGLLWGFEERIPVAKPVTGLCGFKPGELLQDSKNFSKLRQYPEFVFRCDSLPVKFMEFERLRVEMLSDGRIAMVSLTKCCSPSFALSEYKNVRCRLNAYFKVDQAKLDPLQDDSVCSTTYYAQDFELRLKCDGLSNLTLRLISEPLRQQYLQEKEQRDHQKFMETDAAALE